MPHMWPIYSEPSSGSTTSSQTRLQSWVTQGLWQTFRDPWELRGGTQLATIGSQQQLFPYDTILEEMSKLPNTIPRHLTGIVSSWAILVCRRSEHVTSCPAQEHRRLIAEYMDVSDQRVGVKKICSLRTTVPPKWFPLLMFQHGTQEVLLDETDDSTLKTTQLRDWASNLSKKTQFTQEIYSEMMKEPVGQRVIISVEDSFTCSAPFLCYFAAMIEPFDLHFGVKDTILRAMSLMEHWNEDVARLRSAMAQSRPHYWGMKYGRHWMTLHSKDLVRKWQAMLQRKGEWPESTQRSWTTNPS